VVGAVGIESVVVGVHGKSASAYAVEVMVRECQWLKQIEIDIDALEDWELVDERTMRWVDHCSRLVQALEVTLDRLKTVEGARDVADRIDQIGSLGL